MVNIHTSAVSGACTRRTGLWALLAAILFTVTSGTMLTLDSQPSTLIGVGTVLWIASLAFVTVQTATNGSTVVSWLLSFSVLGAVATVFFTPIVVPHQSWLAGALYSTFVLVVFTGTTAHLVGVAFAQKRGSWPRESTRAERLGLLTVLACSGILLVSSLLWRVPIVGL